jgi:trimeric autotransporter adhesin
MNVSTPSMRKLLRFCALGLAMALCLSASEHHGQVKFGGLPMPGVSVMATKGDQKFVAVTDQQGVYAFADLPDGIWNFQIEMLCFEPIKQEVGIAPNAPSPQWELKLQPFDQIKASAPPPEPEKPVTTAAAAAPAATPEKPTKKKGKQSAQVVVPQQGGFQKTDVKAAGDGAKPAANEPPPPPAADTTTAPSEGFLINGSVNNGASSPFAQSAAFGNNRRGARSLYNGNVGFQFGNSALDARPFSLTGQNTPKAAYNFLAGSAAFGGPIKLPHGNPMRRPNFAVTYQFVRSRNANTQSALMPLLAERTGDFSQSILAKALIDPTTGEPFPGNIIPQGRISPQAAALLRFYPAPNFTSSRYNYQAPIKSTMNADNLQARLNKTLNNKNTMSGTFAISRSSNLMPSLFGFTDTTGSQGIDVSTQWVHRFTQRMFGTTRYQFTRGSTRVTPQFAGIENVEGEAGITGVDGDPHSWGPPRLAFGSGLASLGDAQQSFTRNQTHSLGYDLFWSHGAHNIRVGADFRRQQFNLLSQQDPRGTFSFTGDATGYDFADFLLGLPSTTSIAFGNADKYLRANSWDGYFVDDWRISSGFTLNIGGRWEYNSPISELRGRLVNLDFRNGFAAAVPVIGYDPTGALSGERYPGSLVRPDKLGLEPRIGFAWHPILADSLTIRGGYAVNYDTSVYMSIAQRMIQQAPLSKSLTAQRSAANPLTLANGFSSAAGGTANAFAVDPNFQVGYAQTFQFSVQRDLPAGLMATVTYMGIKGTRARQESLPNTYPAGAINPCPACPAGFSYLSSNGNSTRHAGTFQIRRRLRAGLTATAQYTFSKAIDDAMLGGRGQGGSLVAQDWLNLAAERGLSNFDQRHVATFQAQYSSGVGLGGGALMSGWRGAIFKEWTLATQINVGSGLPQTPIWFSAIRGVTGSVRPLYTGAPLYDAPPGLFLNPAAYAAPLPGQWGNAGRDTITGPGQFGLTATLARSFRISERVNTDLRIDANNALNHVTYTSWITSVSNAQFGLPSAANTMRTVRLNLRVRF